MVGIGLEDLSVDRLGVLELASVFVLARESKGLVDIQVHESGV
jgi:hypothetical protein